LLPQTGPCVIFKGDILMAENIWLTALRIFIYGFGTVFIGLVTLMYCVKLMSAVILKMEGSKKND